LGARFAIILRIAEGAAVLAAAAPRRWRAVGDDAEGFIIPLPWAWVGDAHR
jgi:hypothetical protein